MFFYKKLYYLNNNHIFTIKDLETGATIEAGADSSDLFFLGAILDTLNGERPRRLNYHIKNKYQTGKALTRAAAQTFQDTFNYYNYSWSDLATISAAFEKLGRRYGLIKELKNNGII